MARTIVLKGAVGGVAFALIGLVAATPALAHTDNLYGHVFVSEGLQQGFASISKVDASDAPLSLSPLFLSVAGMELVGEVGTASVSRLTDDSQRRAVVDWNHVTGAYNAPVDMFVPGADHLARAQGLTARADGTLLVWITYVANDEVLDAIATLNRVTGELTPVIDLTGFESTYPYFVSDLVSDPVSGVDYALLRSQTDGRPAFMSLDVAAGDHGTPVPFGGTDFAIAEIGGADIAPDGTLYFYLYHYDEAPFDLARLGAPSTWPTANPVVIGPMDEPGQSVEFRALTTDGFALANTGSSLPLAAGLMLGTVAVLAGGVTVMVARRRSQRGMV